MAPQFILVTGANGFLGSHIIFQLLQKGYRVRGTARGAKIALCKEIFASFGDKFQVVSVNDVAKDDVSEHFKGIDAVIHAAAPLPGREDPKALVNGAVEASMNIIRQAEKAGIQRIIYTSSLVTVSNPNQSLTDKDWNPITEEQALVSPPFVAYMGAKTFAEKAVWKFADENKHVDVTSVNPPFLFGPFIPNYRIPKPDYGALSTNLFIYHILTKEGRAFPQANGSADIRDVARVHVEALTSPLTSSSSIGRKRLLIASPYACKYDEAVSLIEEAHPELKNRLVDPSTAPKFPFNLPVDLNRVEDVTGVKVDSYYTWKETILDTIDSLLAIEKGWLNDGHEVEIPPLELYGF